MKNTNSISQITFYDEGQARKKTNNVFPWDSSQSPRHVEVRIYMLIARSVS